MPDGVEVVVAVVVREVELNETSARVSKHIQSDLDADTRMQIVLPDNIEQRRQVPDDVDRMRTHYF